MAKLVVSITHAGDNPDRATTGFLIAQAAALGGMETVVFLSSEGARLSQRGYGDTLRAPGGAPLAALQAGFTAAGGTVWVCGSCFRRRGLSADHLPARTTVVGGATLVEFLSQGAACLTY